MGFLRFIFPAFFIFEVASLIAVASWLGFGWTFLLVTADFVAGVWLLRKMGRDVLAALRGQAMTMERLADALPAAQLRLLAGILLIIPGFVSDALALLLLSPPVQNYAGGLFKRWFTRNAPKPPDGVVIEGEAVEVHGQKTIEHQSRGETHS